MPHGNADPEQGFSVYKKVFGKRGNNLHEDTTESIRKVNHFLNQSDEQNNGNISTETIKMCKDSQSNRDVKMKRYIVKKVPLLLLIF